MKSNKIKWIGQGKYKNGCGLACVAMVSGKKFLEILKKFELQTQFKTINYSDGNLRTELRDIKNLLDSLKIKHSNTRFFQEKKWKNKSPKTQWEKINGKAIVAINYKDNEEWHWVVYSKEKDKIYDPLNKNRGSRKSKISFYIDSLG